MENVIIIILLIGLGAGCIWYLVRAKKQGKKCIGCPYGGQCSSCSCSGGKGGDNSAG